MISNVNYDESTRVFSAKSCLAAKPPGRQSLRVRFNKCGENGKYVVVEIDQDGSGSMDFSEFLTMMANHIMDEMDTKEEICAAFKEFDKTGKGYVDVEDLRNVLTSLGDSLTADEVEEMIKTADIENSGRINYEDFVTKMMSDKSEKRVDIVESSKGDQ